MRAVLVAAAALWISFAAAAADDAPLVLPDSQLEPVAWSDLEGWAADDHLAAFAAYRTSCQPFLNVRQPHDERPVYQALWEVCRRAARVKPADAAAARALDRKSTRLNSSHPSISYAVFCLNKTKLTNFDSRISNTTTKRKPDANYHDQT